MAVMKSDKLRREETEGVSAPQPVLTRYKRPDIFEIRPIQTFQDWVIVIHLAKDTPILTATEQMTYLNCGVVVGKSKSILTPSGVYVDSALQYGDVVYFRAGAVVDDYPDNQAPYTDQKLRVISERNIISKLPAVPFKVIDA